MNNSDASKLKSLGVFALILIASIAVVLFTMSRNESTDVRSRAANPSDTVVDSDAMLDSAEQDVQSSDTDQELNNTSNEGADDAELKEIQGL